MRIDTQRPKPHKYTSQSQTHINTISIPKNLYIIAFTLKNTMSADNFNYILGRYLRNILPQKYFFVLTLRFVKIIYLLNFHEIKLDYCIVVLSLGI